MARRIDRRSQWIKGLLDLCILGILVDGEAYGYEVARRLEAGGIGEIKGGTLYPALSKLEEGGLIAATWRPGDGGPDRKYYRLTELGDEVLVTEAAAWADLAIAVQRLIGVEKRSGT